MLKATQISKVYKTSRGEVVALAPCSLEFAESGLVLICGESGGGKTTLLNILAGTDVPS
ncbi:MAG: AAA family ATPase, partial [Oscillospiraceae bacterium]